MIDNSDVLSKIFKFWALQQGALEYFECVEEVALKAQLPTPIQSATRIARRTFNKKEEERKHKILVANTRYKNESDKMMGYVIEGMSPDQVETLHDISFFFMDVLDKLHLFELRHDKREEFLTDLDEFIKKYKVE